ncbi:hypothetical protein [Roseitranquillus sediminis]|uniref:hypothetical protein n=1 Tax=Roseitranquillus sediminis TaxID=2809051 RepID=UPI001D0CB3A5|nr:hypothetical protein [Roseitranquillus sediminis]MBM9593795.1 hypothetical protein [Roseitranquillus sediminis]
MTYSFISERLALVDEDTSDPWANEWVGHVRARFSVSEQGFGRSLRDASFSRTIEWYDDNHWRSYGSGGLVDMSVSLVGNDDWLRVYPWRPRVWTELSFTTDAFSNLLSVFLDTLEDSPDVMIGMNGVSLRIGEAWYEGAGIWTTSGNAGAQTAGVDILPTPLPATLPLLAGALAGLGWLRHRRVARSAATVVA